MAVRVEIDGVGVVELDEAFRAKTPAEQQAIVSGIAAQHAHRPAPAAPAPAPQGPGVLGGIGNALIRGVDRFGAGQRYGTAEDLAAGARQIAAGNEVGLGDQLLAAVPVLGRAANQRVIANSFGAPREALDAAGRIVAETAQQTDRAQQRFPMTPGGEAVVRDIGGAQGFGDMLGAVGRNLASRPLATMGGLGQLALESAPQIAVAAATRNPALGAAAMGAMSYDTERHSQLGDVARQSGLDVRDPAQARAAVGDAAIMDEQASRGRTRGAVIGALDAVSGGLASKVGGLRGVAANMGAQAGLGGGGEAVAQQLTEDRIAWGEVALEGLAELASAPADVLALSPEARRNIGTRIAGYRERRAARGQTANPTVAEMASDAARGDTEAATILRDMGIDPTTLSPVQQDRAAARIQERRAVEAERARFAPEPRDPAEVEAERNAVAAGDMDPAAAPSANRPGRAPLPPVVELGDLTSPDARPSRYALTGSLGDPGADAGAARQAAQYAADDRAFELARHAEAGRPLPPEQRGITARENMKADAQAAFDLAARRRERFEGSAAAPDRPPSSMDPRPAGRPQGAADQPVTLVDGRPAQYLGQTDDGDLIFAPMVTQTTGYRENQQQSLVLDEDVPMIRVPPKEAPKRVREAAWNPERRQAQEFQDAQAPRRRGTGTIQGGTPVNPGVGRGGMAEGDITTRQVRPPPPPPEPEITPPDGPPPRPDAPRPAPEDADFADMGTGRRVLGAPRQGLPAPPRSLAPPPAPARPADPAAASAQAAPQPDVAAAPAAPPEVTTRLERSLASGTSHHVTLRDPVTGETATVPLRRSDGIGDHGLSGWHREDVDGPPGSTYYAENKAEAVERLVQEWQDGKLKRTHADSAQEAAELGRKAAAARRAAGGSRPLTSRIRRAYGGIKPGSRLHAELRARGITARDVPGLFSNKGRPGFDNIPASEEPDLAATLGVDDNRNYLDEAALAEAIVAEIAGRPQPVTREQAEALATADAYETEARRLDRQERPGSGRETPRAARPPRQDDLFGAEAGVGERQVDIEDLIAERAAQTDAEAEADAFERAAAAASTAARAAGAVERDAGYSARDAEAEFVDAIAEPEDVLSPGQREFLDGYFRELRDVPFSNPWFDPRAYRALGLLLLAGVRKARNRLASLRGSTALTPPAGNLGSREIGSGAISEIFDTMDGRARAMARRFKSPTLNRILDMTHVAAGKASTASGGTVNERQWRKANQFVNRVARALDGLDDAALPKVASALRGDRAPLTPAEQRAYGQLRELFKDALAYMREAGVEVGEVPRDYFPRELDPEKVATNEAGFVKNAEALYREAGASGDDAREQARQLYTAVVTGESLHGGMQHAPRSSGGNFFQDRVFSKRADLPASQGGLRDFMTDDLKYSMVRYIHRATRRAEIARAFGDKFARWPELEAQMDAEGVPASVRSFAAEHVRMNAGLLTPGHGQLYRAAGWASAITTMSLLEYSTLTSLPELATSALRAGSGRELMGSFVAASVDLVRFVTRLGPRERLAASYELAEFLGAVVSDASLGFDIARFHGTDQMSRRQADALGRYFRMIGMHQFTEYTRARSAAIGARFLHRLAAGTQGKSILLPKAGAVDGLAELGVLADDQQEFAAFVAGLDPVPHPGQLTGRMGELYMDALARFTGQSVMRPTPATKPKWASSPWGRIVFSLQSFGYAFTKNVLQRNARQMAAGAKAAARGDARDAALYLLPVGMTALTLPLMAFAMGELRDLLDETLSGKAHRPMTLGARIERALSRAGFFGGADPYLQMLSGTRYNQPWERAAAGPVVGTFSKAASSTVGLLTNNSPETNTAERNALDAYMNVGEGLAASAFARIPVTGVGLGLTMLVRSQRTAILDGVAPVEKDRRSFKPQESLPETLLRAAYGLPEPRVRLTPEQRAEIRASKRAVRDHARR